MDEYDDRQFVGIDLHRQRSVVVRQSESGERLSAVRIVNDPALLRLQVELAGADPEVVLEATYGWYWAVDVLQACGARVHLAHPLGIKGFRYRRVKNDVRDAADLADLLRMGRLPEAWIAPPQTHELRELVRYRTKLVAIRSGFKAQARPQQRRHLHHQCGHRQCVSDQAGRHRHPDDHRRRSRTRRGHVRSHNGDIYVADGYGAASVIDPANNHVIDTLTVGTNPTGLAVDPQDGDVYIANFGPTSDDNPGSITVITPR